MKQDDFDVSLFPEEEPQEEVMPASQPKSSAFDWQRDDPQDFSHNPPPPRTPEKPQGGYDQPLFVQDTFGRREAPESPAPAPAAPAANPPAAPHASSAPAVMTPATTGRVENGRTVLISGGDRGIGAAAARLFWQQGYHTAIFYHKNEAAARALINELGRDCVAVRCDVASREACEAALKVVVRTFGDPDVLVCNAGIAQQKLFTDITEEEWQRMLDVDLTGAFHLCQLVLPGMVHRKHGRILTVSSMWGQTGGSCEVHYSAAKAGVIGLTKALAKEEGPSGITVNCVAPGVIDTEMMNTFSAGDKQALAEETPVGRLGRAEEVARMLVFLAAEEAGYITGQVFGINGGLVI
jgi:3-oxoacyl-[acyl-carrier protein] reductase